ISTPLSRGAPRMQIGFTPSAGCNPSPWTAMLRFVSLALALIPFVPATAPPQQPRVLVFSKTAGFRHSSIPNGIAAIRKLGMENGFDVDTTENAEVFSDDSLQKYSTVIFLSTTGDILDYRQEAAFERFIQAGGG